MGRTIGTVLTLQDKFSPTLGNIGRNIGGFNSKIGGINGNINRMSNNFNNAFNKMGKGAKGTVEKVGSGFKGIGMKVAGLAGGIGIGMFAKESVKLASDLVEVQNVVDTTFGKNSSKINEFAKSSITQFGLSELQAKQFNGTLGAMMKSSGLAGDQLANMSMKLTGLSGDLSSFFNISQEEAFDKIRQGISGETEGLKALGINMNVTNLERTKAAKAIGKEWKEMTQAEQTMVRYNYLMDVTKDHQGDFAKTGGEFANQVRVLKENFKSAGASIATLFLPHLNNVAKTLNGFLTSKNIEWVTNKVKGMADTFGKWVTPKLAEFKSFVTTSLIPKFEDIGSCIGRIVKEHGPALEGAFNAILDVGKNLVELGLWAVHGALKWFDDNKDMVDSALGFIKGSFETLSKFIEGDFKGAFDKAGEAVLNLIDTLSELTLQMASSDNPVMHMIGELADIPVGLAEAIGKGDASRFLGTPEDNLQKKRNERAKSREVNKNYNEMQDHYRDKYKNTKEIKGTNVALPEFASGTSFTPRGFLVKNEKGGEITVSRGGEAIIPADRTERLLKNQSMGNTLVLNQSQNDKQQPNVNIYLTVQGNIIGDEEYANYLGGIITSKVTLALGNM